MHPLYLTLILATTYATVTSPLLQKRFIELNITVVDPPSPYLPYIFPWQHQRGDHVSEARRIESSRLHPEAMAALQQMNTMARKAPAFFITNATVLPPTGDAADFLSYGPYWWPNTTCPTTCSWVELDGIINPDVHKLTQQSDLAAMANFLRISSLAHAFLPPDGRTIDAMVRQLRTWFLNTTTRMHPNINYGQVIRGPDPSMEVGRFEGILSARQLAFVPAAIEVVRRHPTSWTREDGESMAEWARTYLDWLLNPPFVPSAVSNVSNHRTYWACQVVEFQRLLGQHDAATATLDAFVRTYLPLQIDAQGNQPIEFVRTRPVHYAMFNIDALIYLAQFAEQDRPDTGDPYYDFWGARDHAIRRAFDFIVNRYSLDDIEFQDIDMLLRAVHIIVGRYGDPSGAYSAFIRGVGKYRTTPYVISPLFARPEVGV